MGMLQASPDFKGIKTVQACLVALPSALQASPDFKGIKTLYYRLSKHICHASSQP